MIFEYFYNATDIYPFSKTRTSTVWVDAVEVTVVHTTELYDFDLTTHDLEPMVTEDISARPLPCIKKMTVESYCRVY